jgi:hypothetical protein
MPAAAIQREIDPTQDPARAVSVRQFSGDPNATEAPLIGDRERHILTVMREDLQEFPSQRGRLVRDPNDETASIYAPGSAGSPVGDDVRAISGTRSGNTQIAKAIDDLLAGKPLTNKLHVAALDAAQGYAEKRPNYRGPQLPIDRPVGGGGDAVNDFEKFAASLDDVNPSYVAGGGREPGEEGFATVPGLTRVAGAAIGGTAGYATGDTPEERARNAAIGMGLGAAAPSAPKLIAGLMRRDATAAGQPSRPVVNLRPRGSNAEQPAGVLPPGSRAQGMPLRNPLAGTEGFVDKLSGGNPLLREGLTERLEANAGFAAQRRGSLNVEHLGNAAAREQEEVILDDPGGDRLALAAQDELLEQAVLEIQATDAGRIETLQDVVRFLHRLERKGWVATQWQDTPKGRPMKFYRLTPSGRKQLAAETSKWEQVCRAIGLVLGQAES